MLSVLNKVLSLFIIIILIVSEITIAGTTGKITGKVTDKDTGEPLYGVNILVQETNLGAASDIDGNYVILNVPPGVHSLKASMIGYAPLIINDVRVRIDETSPVDIELVSQAIETGDVVVVADQIIYKERCFHQCYSYSTG